MSVSRYESSLAQLRNEIVELEQQLAKAEDKHDGKPVVRRTAGDARKLAMKIKQLEKCVASLVRERLEIAAARVACDEALESISLTRDRIKAAVGLKAVGARNKAARTDPGQELIELWIEVRVAYERVRELSTVVRRYGPVKVASVKKLDVSLLDMQADGGRGKAKLGTLDGALADVHGTVTTIRRKLEKASR